MPQSATLSERAAEFALGLTIERVPPSVVLDAKLRFTDTIGVMLLASCMELAPPLLAVAREQMGREEATIIGSGDRVPAMSAALVNGTFAHGIEYDDTRAESGIHPSCYVVATALAAAERVGASGRAMLEAAIAGWEVTIRMGHAGLNYYSPFHSTAIAGTFGAALIAGRLFGLGVDQIADAMGIAGSQAAGSRQFIEEGAWSKRLHGGWPSHAGIYAALLAGRGFSGPHEIFEGPRGMYRAYVTGPVDPPRLVDGLGTRWDTPATTFKLYPCGQLQQSSMYAVQRILRRDKVAPERIERIDCFVPRETHRAVCEPREIKIHPRTAYHTLFSLPYGVAVAALDGEVSVTSFEEERRVDLRVRAMTERVQCTIDDALPVAAFQPARVEITTTDGSRYSETTSAPGAPENPELRSSVHAKFTANAGRALGTERARDLLALLDALDELDDVRALTRAASRA